MTGTPGSNVTVNQGDLEYVLAHVTDEIHGTPDPAHWHLPLFREAFRRLCDAVGASAPQDGPGVPGGPDLTQVHTFTRDGLVDALTCLKVNISTSGPAAGMVNAESMADAIIEALADRHDPVATEAGGVSQ